MDNTTMQSKELLVPMGGMWEESEWKIAFDEKCSGYGGGVPCHHCHSDHIKYTPGNEFRNATHERKWICPRVIIMKNEGGCNSTGICLDCVLEAAKLLDSQG